MKQVHKVYLVCRTFSDEEDAVTIAAFSSLMKAALECNRSNAEESRIGKEYYFIKTLVVK